LLLAKIQPPDTPSWEPGAGGRRPGGSVPPEGTGVAGKPSPPPVWQGVSDSKQDTEAHPTALGSARMNATLWNRRKPTNSQSTRVIERPSGDGECPTGMRAWGRRPAPRGL